MCAVDQKRPFFPRVGPFLALLPFKGPYGKPLTGEGRSLREGSLTGRVGPFTKKDDEEAYGKAGLLWEAPYEEGRSLREGPGSRTGPSQRRTTKRLTGRQGPYGEAPYEEGRSLREGPVPYGRAGLPYGSFTEKDDEEAYGKAGPLRKALTKRDGSFTEKDDEEAYGKAGPLRDAPYEEERSLREGPEFREDYGKPWGETLPELGGNFRLCAVDQKKPFFLGLGRFWTCYPLRDLSPLQGPLRGPPYGKAPYGEASYGKARPLQEAPYGEGRSLREGPGPVRVLHREGRRRGLREGRALTGKAPYEEGRSLREGPVPYGRAGLPYESFTEKDDEEAYRKAGSLREAPWPLRADQLTGRPLTGGLLTGRPLTGRLLTGRPLTGRFLETPLIITRRDGPYGKGRSLHGPLRADRLTGRPLTRRLFTRRPLTNYRKAYGKLRGGTLPELGGNFRLCAVDQKSRFFLGLGRFWTFCPLRDLSPLQRPFTRRDGPYDEEAYGKAGLLREAPYRRNGPYGKGRSLRGWVPS